MNEFTGLLTIFSYLTGWHHPQQCQGVQRDDLINCERPLPSPIMIAPFDRDVRLVLVYCSCLAGLSVVWPWTMLWMVSFVLLSPCIISLLTPSVWTTGSNAAYSVHLFPLVFTHQEIECNKNNIQICGSVSNVLSFPFSEYYAIKKWPDIEDGRGLYPDLSTLAVVCPTTAFRSHSDSCRTILWAACGQSDLSDEGVLARVKVAPLTNGGRRKDDFKYKVRKKPHRKLHPEEFYRRCRSSHLHDVGATGFKHCFAGLSCFASPILWPHLGSVSTHSHAHTSNK